MSILKEFKEFAVKGNAFDLAVGVIIGGAFGKIVTALVDDLIMPIAAAIFGKPDFSNLYYAMGKGAELIKPGTALAEARKLAPEAAIFAYGNFITVFISFIMLAFVVFMMVRYINKLKKEEVVVEAPPAGPSQEDLLAEIRDLLKK